MITDTGQNLDVAIITDSTKNWETFATWYSVNKNLPEAYVRIFCLRSKTPSFQLFQWAKRLNVPVYYFNSTGSKAVDTGDKIVEIQNDYLNWLNILLAAKSNNLVKNCVLMISELTMVLQPLPDNMLAILNGTLPFRWINEHAWYVKDHNAKEIDKYLKDYHELNLSSFTSTVEMSLCYDAKSETKLRTFVNYKKGCGRWIHTARGCPFANAAGLMSEDMTPNEKSIIELWDRMVPVYNLAV